MNFVVTAYRRHEGAVQLPISAEDSSDAKRQAEDLGYQVISVRRNWRISLPQLGKRRRFSVSQFSFELLALLEAGLSLVESVDLIGRKATDAHSRRVLETLARSLQEGLPLSRALQGLPGAFPELYVATIRSSEQTGNLEDALRRYLAYDEQLNKVRDKVVSASVYPALLIILGAAVVLFLLGYVVPRFSRVYEDLGHDLPMLSELLMRWGRFVGENALLFAATALSFMVLGVWGFLRPATWAAVERGLWSIPGVGEKLMLYQLARFTRTLSMLLKGGIPFVTAMEMVGDLLRQPALRQGLRQATRAVREGQPVSAAMAGNRLATEVGARLLIVGERTGDLAEIMERIAKLYDADIARWVDWFTRLFEPVLMLLIGLLIGAIVLLMYLPIFELASSIQ